ncbi:MAG: protoporphyrinogen/coproporphyrinogen oxidase [Actinomycetota bacterium]|nr:protoporphyrinogen/coproporphyrinogen oxidase [Actinomycetota bacterium]
MKVAVVGGGISGLTAAWYASKLGAEVVVHEASERLGGKISRATIAGQQVDTGADAFLARVPEGIELCRDLGLGDELVSPATGRAYVWTRGALRPLPDGLVLGVPTDLPALARSGILSPSGLARAGLDVVLPRVARHPDVDVSVADVITERFGPELTDRLVDPLLGGINAGRADQLSLESSAAQLAAACRSGRSLVLALRKQRRSNPPSGAPVFYAVRGGMTGLTDRLCQRLDAAGVWLQTNSPVATLDDVDADRVIVTTPASVTAALVGDAAPDAASALRTIEYASVALTLLAYPSSALTRPLDGSGFLVPRVDGRLMTACSWASSKWAELASPETVLLRVSAGRIGDERTLELDDDELVERLHLELVEAMGLTAEPSDATVVRWHRAFPQYRPGHRALVDRILTDVKDALPGVELAGAAYRGVGIPACIATARRAAEAVAGPG